MVAFETNLHQFPVSQTTHTFLLEICLSLCQNVSHHLFHADIIPAPQETVLIQLLHCVFDGCHLILLSPK